MQREPGAMSRLRGGGAQQQLHLDYRRNDARGLHTGGRCSRVPKGASSGRSECAAGVLVLH